MNKLLFFGNRRLLLITNSNNIVKNHYYFQNSLLFLQNNNNHFQYINTKISTFTSKSSIWDLSTSSTPLNHHDRNSIKSNSNSNSNSNSVKLHLEISRQYLKSSKNNDIKESRILDSRILLEHVLNLRPNERVKPNLNFTDKQKDLFIEYIERRFNNEPIAYIVGYKYFWKHQFKCDRSTLIPRADSETLLDQLVFLRDNESFSPAKVLDLGTGTGCLVLSVLEEFPKAKAIAVDQSLDALSVASENAKALGFQDRIHFIESNWLSFIDQQKDQDQDQNQHQYQLIISNPPYISSTDYSNLNETVKSWEPITALVANNNGLEDYENIAKSIVSKDILDRESGLIIFEIGRGQENDIIEIMNRYGFKLKCTRKDLGGIIRCLVFNHK